MSEPVGDKGQRAESGLTLRDDARLERIALAKGWLKNASGKGLDNDKLGNLIERNYERAMATEDDRALASLTRNVQTAVAQVMQHEQSERGVSPSGTPSITIVEVVISRPQVIEVTTNGRYGGD